MPSASSHLKASHCALAPADDVEQLSDGVSVLPASVVAENVSMLSVVVVQIG